MERTLSSSNAPRPARAPGHVHASRAKLVEAIADPAPHVVARWVWAFMVLGLTVRVVRYALRFPLWEDECFLCANLMDRSYAELMSALDYRQVAPLAFLWMQKTVVLALGFNELSLRLVPFLAGIASLFLFRRLAGKLLSGTALVIAVAWFAVSYPLIRYSAEAKPYGCDVFLSLVMLSLTIEWLQNRRQTGRLWLLAALAPLAVALSYPTLFVAGGISLAILVAWRQPRGTDSSAPFWQVAAPWLAFNLAVAGTFVAVFTLSTARQSANDLQWMQTFWQGSFPPLAYPWKLPGWLLSVHTGEMLAYPLGAGNGASTLTALAVGGGLFALWRMRNWPLAALAVTPLALNLLAAALGRYPYGVQTRLALYHAPWFCLLAGLGAATAVAWLQRRREKLRDEFEPAASLPRPAVIALSILAVIALGICARDVAWPYKTLSDQRARDFARWCWFDLPHTCEVVCVRSDLHREFHPTVRDELCWMTMYLCNQRIYSPRHAARRPPAWDRVSAARPLWCLEFVPSDLPLDQQAEAAWLSEMQARYELIGRLRLPMARYDKREHRLACLDYVDVYQFAPRKPAEQTADERAEAAERR